jgi:antitoxin VapB
MSIQIANPKVVAKIARLAAETGLTKTAAAEKAVDSMLAGQKAKRAPGSMDRFRAILAQMDRIPDRSDAFDPLEWDEYGLPK